MNRLVSKKGAFSLAHVRGPIRRQLGGVQSYLLTNDFDSRPRNGFAFSSISREIFAAKSNRTIPIKEFSSGSRFFRWRCENDIISRCNCNRFSWWDWLLFGSKNNRMERKYLGTSQRKNRFIQIYHKTRISRFSRGS